MRGDFDPPKELSSKQQALYNAIIALIDSKVADATRDLQPKERDSGDSGCWGGSYSEEADLNDAIAGTYETLSAGIPENAAIMVMEQAAKGAQAGVGTLAEALDVGTSVMNAWNMQGTTANATADQMGKIMGMAATAAQLGKTTFADLSVSIGQVAPVMAAANVPAEQFFAAISALTATGLPTSSAMTSLQQAISNIIKPTADAQKMAQQLGLDFSITALQSQGLSVFLDNLKQATGGNIEAMGALFGSTEALGAMISLTGNQAGLFKTALDAMGGSQATLNRMSQAYVDNNPGLAYEQSKAALQVLAVEIGTAVLPALNMLLEQTKPLIIAFSEWITKNPEVSGTLLTIVASLGAAMAAIGPILIALPGLATAWGWVSSAVTAVGSVITAFIAGAAWPIVAAIAAIVAAASALWYYWDEVKSGLTAIWNGISSAFWSIFGPIIEGIQAMTGWGIGPGAVSGGGGVGMATGGTVQQSGWAVVGERGPELVQMPRGATVYDAQQSAPVVQGGGTTNSQNVTVNFNRDSVRSDDDIRQIERALTRLIGSGMTANGTRAFA